MSSKELRKLLFMMHRTALEKTINMSLYFYLRDQMKGKSGKCLSFNIVC